MRKLTLLAGTVALIALSGCAYNDGYYGDGYYGDGYYGGAYGDYYGPGYYDPYYSGPDWYFDGSYYFYYDRHSHRWHRRDHGDRDHRGDHRGGDRDWGRSHDWHSDRKAPWNRPGVNTQRPQPQQTQQQSPDRRFRGSDHNWNRGDSGRRSYDRGQVSQPRPLAQPSTQQPPPPDRSDRDSDNGRDRPQWRDRGNHDHR